MLAELVVIVPTLGRPHALAPLVESFQETTPSHRILFVADPDDIPTRGAVAQLQHDYAEIDIVVHGGSYPVKVNAGIYASDEPLILVGADDIGPHPGWLETARAHMSETIGFVSLNDLGNHDVMAGRYATLPLVARWYAESEGHLYHEVYEHTGCDVDASLRAQERGAYAYAPDAVMEHLHPVWEKGEVDETYRRGGMNERKRETDDALLARRWPNWERILQEAE